MQDDTGMWYFLPTLSREEVSGGQGALWTKLTCLQVVERDHPRKLVGIISLNDLLKGSACDLQEGQDCECVLGLSTLFKGVAQE